MDIPDPPSPAELQDAGITLSEPAPEETSSGEGNMFADLIPKDKKAQGTNMFADLIPSKPKSGGLEQDRPVEHVPGMDWAGSILHGMNKANPLIWGPELAEYAGYSAANAVRPYIGKEPLPDNEETRPTKAFMEKYFVPNTADTGVNKALSEGGNFAMSIPQMGAAIEATPFLGSAASADYIPYAKGATGLIGKTGQALGNAGRAVVRGGQSLLKGAIAAPEDGVPALAKSVAGNVGAGAGFEGAREKTENAPSYVRIPAEMGGAMLGGSLPAAAEVYGKYLSPVMWAKRFGNRVYADLTGADEEAIKSGTADDVLSKFRPHRALVNQFSGLKTSEAQEGLADAARLRKNIPGFNPTLGEASGLQSALTQQANTESGSTGNILDSFARRKTQQGQALEDYAKTAGPQIDGKPSFEAGAQRRIDNIQQPLASQADSVQRAREGVADTLTSAKPYDTGSYLRNRLENLAGEKQKEMSQLADDMGLNNARTLRVSGDSLQKAVKSALPSKFAANTSPTMRQIADLDKGSPLTFADAKYFMENLGQEARQAAKFGNNSDARIIGSARNNIDNYLKDEWAPALGIGDKYSNFRNRYLSEYVNRFDKGTAGDVTKLGSDNRYSTDNEDVAGKFFQPGNVTAAKDFHGTFGGDPMALEAVQAHVLDDVRNKAVKDRVIDPKALDRWMSANRDNLAEFPSIQATVQNAQKLNAGLVDRQATLTSRQEAVEDSQLAKALGSGKTYQTLMSDPALLKRTAADMTDSEKQALARHMWTDATSKMDSPDKMGSFIMNNGEQLSAVMSPEHLQNLKDLHKAIVMDARTGMPRGSANIASPIESFTGASGISPQNIMSRGYAMARHVVSPEYIMADILTKMGIATSRVTSKKMVGRAIYDPEFANALSKFMANPADAAKVKTMKAYMFRSGLGGTVDEGNEEE